MPPIQKNYRKLGLCLAISAICNSQLTIAQENSQNEKLIVEEILVTGSRILRTDLTQPSPVISINAGQIMRAGTPDLGGILSTLPAVGSTDTLQGNAGSNALAGISSADLRRLGSNRTLVLIDGKRHIGAVAGSAQVDLSTVPIGLIENVEILTGGTSAVYGSDAVSGVINVKLKDNFTGFEANLSGADSTEGVGARNHNVNVLAGANIADGKGNVTFYAGLTKIREVLSNDTQHLDNWGTVENPEDTGENDGIPDRLRSRNVFSEFISYTGVLNPFTGSPQRWVFNEAGTPIIQTERNLTNSFAFGNFPDGCEFCFKPEDYENILPASQAVNIATSFNYRINDAIKVFADVKFVRTDIEQQFQPSFRFGNIEINVADNPYLDDDVRQQLLDADVESAAFAKFFDELGNRSADNRRETARIVTGFDGLFQLGKTDFVYELFYINSETSNELNTLNDLIPTNLVAAIDAVVDPETGEIACRSQVPDLQFPNDDGTPYSDPAAVNGQNCVPYNPFGYQQASVEARDWVAADVQRRDKITQEIFGGFVSFDSSELFELPGGAVGVAIGFEQRTETSASFTDEFTQRGFLTSAATPNQFGEFEVDEYFMEVSLPLISGVAGIEELTVDLAYRTANYDPFGRVNASKLGFIYSPIESLTIRGTWGEAVRAPNIGEAFDAISPGFAQIDDPCDEDQIDDDPDRRANCAAIGVPDNFEANDNVSIDILSGGNPNLRPEDSTSYTFGVVWTPAFADALSLTVDYYEIELKDAIIEVTAQQVLDNCVDASGGPDADYCAQIDRDPTTNDVELVRSGNLNAAALTTKGVELRAQYGLALEDWGLQGALNLSLNANHLIELERFEFQTRPDEINVEHGEVGDPEWQLGIAANYQLDNFSANWSLRYLDRVVTYDVSPGGGSPEDLSPSYVPSFTSHDLSFGFQVTDKLTLTAGAINLFNRLPPGYTVDPSYDLIGRRVFASANVKF